MKTVEQVGIEPTSADATTPAHPEALPFERLFHICPAGIPAGAPCGELLLTGCSLFFSQEGGAVHTPLEGKAGFEPTTFRCAADVLPGAPLAHITRPV